MTKLMMNKRNIIMFAALVAIGVFGRLLPHAWNFTPLIATTIFAGVYLGKKYAFFLPIITMLISDTVVGFYDPKIMLSVYFSFAIAGLIGYCFAKNKKINNLALSAFASSTIFFLITNAAVWFFGNMYSISLNGLFQSYLAGIPFYRNMMLGDITYTIVLFSAYEYSLSVIKKLKTEKESKIFTASKTQIL
jgi:hypothetical protein